MEILYDEYYCYEYYCNDCGKKFFHSPDYHIICPHCLGMDTETRISREGEI